MKKVLFILKNVISAWLKSSGCDLGKWAPGAALFHYLEGSGKDLDLNQFPYVEELAALEISYALANGFVSENGRCVHCNYFSTTVYEWYMMTPTPDLGVFFEQFNELTATIGGYTAVDKGDHYLIVDRYDWYGVENGVEIPPVVGKLLKHVPKPVIQKLGITPNTDRDGWFLMDQENLRWVGKSFNSILKVDKRLLESQSFSETSYEGESHSFSSDEKEQEEDENFLFDIQLNSAEEASFNGDIGSSREKTEIADSHVTIEVRNGIPASIVTWEGDGFCPGFDLYKEWTQRSRRSRSRRPVKWDVIKVIVPYGVSPVWAKAVSIPQPDEEEDYED